MYRQYKTYTKDKNCICIKHDKNLPPGSTYLDQRMDQVLPDRLLHDFLSWEKLADT